MKSISLLSSAIIATSISSVHGINFKLDTASCDGNPFKSNIKATCNDSSTCNLGDTVDIAGTLVAHSAFDNDEINLQACAMGYCPEDASKKSGNICDWLVTTEYQTCGDAGTYTISYTEEIPNDLPSNWASWVTYLITIKVTVGDEEECNAQANTAYSMSSLNSAASSNSSYLMAGLGALALVGAAVYATKRRSMKNESAKDDLLEMRDSPAAIV